MLREHFFLMLKTVALLNILVKTVVRFFLKDFLMSKKLKRKSIINVFTVIFKW